MNSKTKLIVGILVLACGCCTTRRTTEFQPPPRIEPMLDTAVAVANKLTMMLEVSSPLSRGSSHRVRIDFPRDTVNDPVNVDLNAIAAQLNARLDRNRNIRIVGVQDPFDYTLGLQISPANGSRSLHAILSKPDGSNAWIVKQKIPEHLTDVP
ncbi:MAG TPA: hypothetical protein DIT01_18095 [Lentisphaeria bacterium]|nr:hypothetical protein [Lentisphaeria bacterium]